MFYFSLLFWRIFEETKLATQKVQDFNKKTSAIKNQRKKIIFAYTVEPGYDDIGLYDTSLIALDILWYQLIRHC
jgi:hypothetical protein